MSETSLQVLGLCRFSYPVEGGKGFTQRVNMYDIDRLASRLNLFQRLWVPSMRRQTDKRFSVVILIGAGIPEVILKPLQEAVSGCPQIILHKEEDGQPHIDVCSKVLRTHRNPEAEVTAEFLLDDDDTVSLDFVGQVHQHFVLLEPSIRAVKHVELDFCRGYVARIEGESCQFKEVLSPHWTCGQVIFQTMPSRTTVANFHHYRFWKKHLCLTNAKQPMFIRSLHEGNDTGNGLSESRWVKFKSEGILPPAPEFSCLIERKFGVDLVATHEGLFTFP